jgi:hypothetical protein
VVGGGKGSGTLAGNGSSGKKASNPNCAMRAAPSSTSSDKGPVFSSTSPQVRMEPLPAWRWVCGTRASSRGSKDPKVRHGGGCCSYLPVVTRMGPNKDPNVRGEGGAFRMHMT